MVLTPHDFLLRPAICWQSYPSPDNLDIVLLSNEGQGIKTPRIILQARTVFFRDVEQVAQTDLDEQIDGLPAVRVQTSFVALDCLLSLYRSFRLPRDASVDALLGAFRLAELWNDEDARKLIRDAILYVIPTLLRRQCEVNRPYSPQIDSFNAAAVFPLALGNDDQVLLKASIRYAATDAFKANPLSFAEAYGWKGTAMVVHPLSLT